MLLWSVIVERMTLTPKTSRALYSKAWTPMEYFDPQDGQTMCGLRLVLTSGVPTGWGESTKAIFRLKRLTFVPIAQHIGKDNAELVAWTGTRLAPVAIYEDEAPRDKWYSILLLAERLRPEPALVPVDPRDRALMFGLANEICGEDGFGWNRRLIILQRAANYQNDRPRPSLKDIARLRNEFGLSRTLMARAPGRVISIMTFLAETLKEQKAAGSPYFVGKALTAVDIYWACFSILLDPFSNNLNPISDYYRKLYTDYGSDVRDAIDPILMEHRDRIFEEHLSLPLDF